jgi:hypothetical protein
MAVLVATGCDERNQVHIVLSAPYAGKANPAGSERVLAGARVRLGEHGFVHEGGEASQPDGELWAWHEGADDALESRLTSSDDGIAVTLRQVKGERGPQFNAMLNTLSRVVSACMMTAPSAAAGSLPARR